MKLGNINSGKVLESPDGNSGTQLDQSAYSGANTQQWRFVYDSGGYFSLVNRATGYLTDVSDTSNQGSAVIARATSPGRGVALRHAGWLVPPGGGSQVGTWVFPATPIHVMYSSQRGRNATV
ncbi:RICIN domain-containing protein [Streptomyces sp. NPDC058457]|uniref:RICIN domain-containing protein n=1 Tax=Streptomyces sp. NPDC058457 TaxID=3346507 RepID=UPI0036530795